MAAGPELIAEAGQSQVQGLGGLQGQASRLCFLGSSKQEEKEGERRAMEGHQLQGQGSCP
jgi:hypothetical protein